MIHTLLLLPSTLTDPRVCHKFGGLYLPWPTLHPTLLMDVMENKLVEQRAGAKASSFLTCWAVIVLVVCHCNTWIWRVLKQFCCRQ